VLEFVDEAGWLRGRFAVSCCALGARRGWHINIRDGGKSGHLECVEMNWSSLGIFGLLWLHNWTVKR
jgi:hypothetical protein